MSYVREDGLAVGVAGAGAPPTGATARGVVGLDLRKGQRTRVHSDLVQLAGEGGVGRPVGEPHRGVGTDPPVAGEVRRLGVPLVAGDADAVDEQFHAVRAGDVVTVKGSLGTRMGPIVKAMTARFPVVQADD